MKTEVIKLTNMNCGGCGRKVESALSPLKGVKNVKVNLNDGTVTIEHEESDELSIIIRETLKEWGYPEATN